MRDIVQPSRSLTAFVRGAREALHGFRRLQDMAFADGRSSKVGPSGFESVTAGQARLSILALLAIVLVLDVTPVQARPYAWGFVTALDRHGVRARRPHVYPPAEMPVAEVPLPVPRPHFTGESAPAGTSAVPPPLPAPIPPAPMPPAPMPPGVAPSGAKLGEAPGQPVADAACPERLKARNVVAVSVSIGPQPDVRCTVVEAVRLDRLVLPWGATVDFPDRPTIACTTADAFSLYVRDLLAPLAKGTYGASVGAVWTGPGLECRSRDHIFGAKLSAHGQGLAVDIAQVKLTDGRIIAIGQPKVEADRGFQTAARAAGCGYFHTALGPGSDSYHRTHWHFDLEVRGSGGDSKYCK